MAESQLSWGRYFSVAPEVMRPAWQSDIAPLLNKPPLLCYGNGRSYGDSCLLRSGTLIDMRALNRVISFDTETGVLRAEAGILLADILALIVPQGWFLPVSPGTKFVTLGGAIANDVHGKNHHKVGSFGHHVRRFGLRRSDSGYHECSSIQNKTLFRSTVGGLGLTGAILWAEIQLQRIQNAYLAVETIRYRSLPEYFALCRESGDYTYVVAWLDCSAPKKERGRGLFMRAKPCSNDADLTPHKAAKRLTMPFAPPFSCVNSLSLKLFNYWYYNRMPDNKSMARQHYDPYFYPLDAIGGWNKMYGRRGFMQHQCVLPPQQAQAALEEMLDEIAAAKAGSFLVVLKDFGDMPNAGLLSFPMPGTTLAIDFPYRGAVTIALLHRLDAIVLKAGGRVYPAKDACMTAASFQAFYPAWVQLEQQRDPLIHSAFWQRVTEPLKETA